MFTIKKQKTAVTDNYSSVILLLVLSLFLTLGAGPCSQGGGSGSTSTTGQTDTGASTATSTPTPGTVSTATNSTTAGTSAATTATTASTANTSSTLAGATTAAGTTGATTGSPSSAATTPGSTSSTDTGTSSATTNPNPTTYYVSTSGSDTNDGSQNSPFRSIQKAADVVNPGDTVIVQSGTYQTTDPNYYAIVNLNRSGTASQWITFSGQPGAVLDGQNNATAYGWFLEASACYVAIQGFDIQNCQLAAIYSDPQSHDFNLAGNSMYACGMDLAGSNVQVINNTVCNCTVWWALNLSGSNWVINGNSFSLSNPTRQGHINLGGPSSDVQISHNLSVEPNTCFLNISPATSTFTNVTVTQNFTTAAEVVMAGNWGISETNNVTAIGP